MSSDEVRNDDVGGLSVCDELVKLADASSESLPMRLNALSLLMTADVSTQGLSRESLEVLIRLGDSGGSELSLLAKAVLLKWLVETEDAWLVEQLVSDAGLPNESVIYAGAELALTDKMPVRPVVRMAVLVLLGKGTECSHLAGCQAVFLRQGQSIAQAMMHDNGDGICEAGLDTLTKIAHTGHRWYNYEDSALLDLLGHKRPEVRLAGLLALNLMPEDEWSCRLAPRHHALIAQCLDQANLPKHNRETSIQREAVLFLCRMRRDAERRDAENHVPKLVSLLANPDNDFAWEALEKIRPNGCSAVVHWVGNLKSQDSLTALQWYRLSRLVRLYGPGAQGLLRQLSWGFVSILEADSEMLKSILEARGEGTAKISLDDYATRKDARLRVGSAYVRMMFEMAGEDDWQGAMKPLQAAIAKWDGFDPKERRQAKANGLTDAFMCSASGYCEAFDFLQQGSKEVVPRQESWIEPLQSMACDEKHATRACGATLHLISLVNADEVSSVFKVLVASPVPRAVNQVLDALPTRPNVFDGVREGLWDRVMDEPKALAKPVVGMVGKLMPELAVSHRGRALELMLMASSHVGEIPDAKVFELAAA